MAIGDGLNNAKKNAEDLSKNLKDVANDAAFTENALKSIAQTFKDAISEAIEAANGLDSATKKVGSSLARDVVNNIKKLGPSLEKSISLQQKLNQGQDISADLAKEQLKTEATRTAIEARILQLKNEGIATDDIEAALLSQIVAEEKEIARLREAQNDISEENAAKIQKANDLLGFTGKTLGALNALTKGFGGALGLDKVEAKMKAVAKETAEANKNFAKMRVFAAGAGEAINQLGNNLMDPGFLLTNMIVGFNKVDKAATDFQRQTGEDLNTLNTSLSQFNGGLVTSAELIEAASDITKEFGINATAAFDMENIGEIASMKKELGLAANEAANLARLSKVNGGNIEMQNEAIVDGINFANRQNRTAVAHGQVLRDVANVSEGIAISYAGYPEKLGAAATAARGLGMTLSDIDRIAGSLLQFESSIAAEMEAELLTGQNLNLEKARQLALNNDLEGVARELANQGITSAKFSKMNRIQQEAQAKALGMNRDEMAKMLLQQQIGNDLSGEGLNAAQKATLEDLKRVDAQEKFATAIGKLQQALAPIVGFFADILSNSFIIYSVMGVALMSKLPMMLGFFSKIGNAIKAAAINSKLLVSKGGIGKLFSKGDTDKAAEVTKKMSGGGPGVKKNLTGLAAGLRSMGTGPVARGAINLGLFGVAAIPAIASIPFLTFMGLTPLTLLKTNMQSLAAGLRSMGTAIQGIGAFAALAAASILMIPGSVGLALFAGAAALASLTIPPLAVALEALGVAMTTGVGAIGLAALVTTAVGLGAAFALVGIGALAMGKGIQLAAQGFAIMVPHILSLVSVIPALFLLGGALVSIGAGLGLIATMGLMALPVLLALGAVGAVAGVVGGVTGGEGGNEGGSSSMAGVEAKLDKLISLVEAGGDVYIDGAKVGKTLQLASSRMG